MSNLRKASLVLRTSDIAPQTAVVQGYYSAATTLNVTAVTSGTIAASSIISGSGTVAQQVTLGAGGGTSAGGVGTITTAGQTVTGVVQSFSSNLYTLYQTATTSQAGSSISAAGVLTIGGANAAVVVGQYLSGTGIVVGTVITAQITGTTFQVNNNFSVASTTISFYTLTNIAIGMYVVGAGIPAGTTITAGPITSATYGLIYSMSNNPTAVTPENMQFYNPLTITCTGLSDATSMSSVGSSNSLRTLLTWNNINMRTVLGDMYDKFDVFNLCLTSISNAAPIAAVSPDANNLAIVMKLSGLPLLNQTYNAGRGRGESATVFATYLFSAAPNIIEFTNNSICTFSKNSDITNITISYERVIDGLSPGVLGTYLTPAAASPYPHIVFTFDIIGVERGANETLKV